MDNGAHTANDAAMDDTAMGNDTDMYEGHYLPLVHEENGASVREYL